MMVTVNKEMHMENTQVLRRVGLDVYDDLNAVVDGFSHVGSSYDYTGSSDDMWNMFDNDTRIDFAGDDNWEC